MDEQPTEEQPVTPPAPRKWRIRLGSVTFGIVEAVDRIGALAQFKKTVGLPPAGVEVFVLPED